MTTAEAAAPEATVEPPQDTPAEQIGQEVTGAEIVQFRPRNSLAAKMRYAETLAKSGLLPNEYRRQPANVLYAVEYGEMLSISALAAITGIHIIEGKPSASAALMTALVRRAGHKLRVSFDHATMTATARLIRSDDPDFVFESVWTLDRAITARLCELRDGKPYARTKKGEPGNWEKYPVNMLKARATSEVCRDGCEEVLSGVHYTPEELGAEVDEDGIPLGRTTVEQVEVDWNAEIKKCGGDREKLVALWKTAPRDSEARDKIAEAAAEAAKAAKQTAAGNGEGPTARTMTEESNYADAPARAVEEVIETVDAEFVEEDEPKQPISPAQVAAQCVDRLIVTAEVGEVAGIISMLQKAPKVATMNATGLLVREDAKAAAAELDIQGGDKVTVADLATLVLAYLEANGYSVANGVAVTAEQLKAAS